VNLHAIAIGAHDVKRMLRDWEAERYRQSFRRVGGTREQPHPLRITRDVFEQYGGRLGLSVVDDFGKCADLEIPVGAFDQQ